MQSKGGEELSDPSFNLPSYSFNGKATVITGAGQGIGKWIALALAHAGADVCIADINLETARQTCSEIKTLGRKACYLEADLSKPEACSSLMNFAHDSFGKLDLVVNNAGVNVHKKALDITPQDFDFIANLNSRGVYFCCQAAAKIMVPAGKGKIVNTASSSAFLVRSGVPNSVYALTKAGIVMLTKALAEEWAQYNINVNAVAPGYMETPLVADRINDPGCLQRILESTPLKRIGQPEDLVGAYLYLLSDLSDYITGQTICVDGGRTIL
jgi:2-deoxy-D-gluconate 3-dehydrogenase